MRDNENSRTRATAPKHEMAGMATQGCPKRYPSRTQAIIPRRGVRSTEQVLGHVTVEGRTSTRSDTSFGTQWRGTLILHLAILRSVKSVRMQLCLFHIPLDDWERLCQA